MLGDRVKLKSSAANDEEKMRAGREGKRIVTIGRRHETIHEASITPVDTRRAETVRARVCYELLNHRQSVSVRVNSIRSKFSEPLICSVGHSLWVKDLLLLTKTTQHVLERYEAQRMRGHRQQNHG